MNHGSLGTLGQPAMRALTMVALSALSLAIACGGPKEPSGPQGAGAGGPGGAGSTPAGGTEVASGDPGKGAGPGTTTTPAAKLPDGGELQGAKLQSATTTTSIENRTEGTKAPQGGSNEPGRKREDIQTIVMARRDEARKCYDDRAKNHPGVEGDLVIKWKIDPKGNVQEIMADDEKSQIHDASIANCVIDIIKKIKFAESAKGFETRTSYPFNFKSRLPPKKPAGSTP